MEVALSRYGLVTMGRLKGLRSSARVSARLENPTNANGITMDRSIQFGAFPLPEL